MTRRLALFLTVASAVFSVAISTFVTKPVHASQTLLSISSAGKKSTYRSSTFHAAGSWQLWTDFNCTGVLHPDFHVTVLKPKGKNSGLAGVHVRTRYRNEGKKLRARRLVQAAGPFAVHLAHRGVRNAASAEANSHPAGALHSAGSSPPVRLRSSPERVRGPRVHHVAERGNHHPAAEGPGLQHSGEQVRRCASVLWNRLPTVHGREGDKDDPVQRKSGAVDSERQLILRHRGQWSSI